MKHPRRASRAPLKGAEVLAPPAALRATPQGAALVARQSRFHGALADSPSVLEFT
ncbi:hypothetical protein J2W49_001222 [Hydrogenophaga palleronii]|uniref:Uncharacterized protein n=1 Tax=Hydrogenophaga palleronii TaxID=65655 RepID=A0ABU1WJ45_9BURK|nr:hypothetical protein [Hydrogenophaga palleronii]